MKANYLLVAAGLAAILALPAKALPPLTDDIPGDSRGCDVAGLNAALMKGSGHGQGHVDNTMPSYCLAYTNNTYADLNASLPMYVGTPDRGGRWVEPKDYAKALAAYNARITTENAAARQLATSGY